MRIANPTARLGEDSACRFLEKLNYKIIDRNFRVGYGEIDIVAVHDNTLVFVEVKTRSSDKFGTPFEAITPWKLKPLIRTAQFYKQTHKNLPEEMRIDAIGVKVLGSEVTDIEHIQNITGF